MFHVQFKRCMVLLFYGFSIKVAHGLNVILILSAFNFKEEPSSKETMLCAYLHIVLEIHTNQNQGNEELSDEVRYAECTGMHSAN